jgi:hypothetical protein
VLGALALGATRAAAAQSPAARAEALRKALVDHERPMLTRDASLVAAKFARMARTKFAFFRGTAWLAPPEPTRFSTPASSQLAVIGDPHPENVGTFVDSRGVRRLDFNDFDLAGYGSYLEDLRRLAVGLWIVADMADLKHKQRARVVEEVVGGYLTEVRGLAAGKPPIALRADDLSGALEEILAAPDDDAREEPASSEETALAKAVLATYPKTLVRPVAGSFAIKRVARRHAGVSSFPVLRLRVVVEGPTADPGDDWALELKESVDRPAGLVIGIQRQFQEKADVDPFLGWGTAGGRELRVRQLLPSQRRLDAERLAKQVKSPRWGKGDLKDLSSALGRLLARGHARASGKNGKPGLSALTAAITSEEGLREETVAVAQKLAERNTEDFHVFQKLLEERGATLGWGK